MSKNSLLNFFLISILIGVFVNNLLFDIKLSFLVLLLLVILFLNFLLYYTKFLKVILFIIVGFILGAFISKINLDDIVIKNKLLENTLQSKKVTIEFSIKKLDRINEDSKIYVSKLISINEHELNKKIEFLSYVPLNYNLKNGDILEEKVKLYGFKNSKNFKYREFMISRNIYFKVYLNNFLIKGYINQNHFLTKIRKTRENFINIIHKLYTEKEAIFLAGILLGAREDLPKELKTNFNNSGLTHFIAVSGFNITILIVFFSLFLKYFPVWFRYIAISSFIIIFVLLVGFSISVVRAAIMGLIAYFILLSGRKGNVLSIVLITAFILVIFSPYSLNYDVSLHLSFLAVLGIIYCQGFFVKIFSFLPETLAIRESFVLTLSALTFAVPIMIFNFGQVSMLAAFANLSVTWTIPIAMFLGFLSIIMYYVYIPLGWIVSYFAWIFLKWDMLMVEYFGTREWALLKFEDLEYTSYLKLVYFIVLASIIIYFKTNKKGE